MATHVGLKMPFCTHCGAYGKDMAVFLHQPCPPLASKAGRKVLASLDRRIMPSRWNPFVAGCPMGPGPPDESDSLTEALLVSVTGLPPLKPWKDL